MAASKLLGIYLNDHLAAATIAVELAKRALRENRGTELGSFLESFVRELEEDRAQLERLLEHLGVPRSRCKRSAAVVLERVGRLKLNGRLTGYSDLSRLLELEGLTAGVEAKLRLLRNLRETTEIGALVGEVDLTRLEERATRQRSALEEHGLAAAMRALRA